jgi:transcriptional regulator with XRE-family HTH domain
MPTFTVEQIRAARAFFGWTQTDLGEAAGLSHKTIYNFETSGFPLSPASRVGLENVDQKTQWIVVVRRNRGN